MLACAPTRQSRPSTTPLPITANGPIRQPGPISTPASMTQPGPSSAVGSTEAVSSTTAVGWMPGEVDGAGWNSAATRAQAAYGSFVTMAIALAGTCDCMSG